MASFSWLFGLESLVPSTTNKLPEDYVERVKSVHESGGYGSRGYVTVYNSHFNYVFKWIA